MRETLRPAVTLFVLFSLLLGAAYPAFVTLVGHAFFYEKAHGSLIIKDGKPLGSALIGQEFSDPKYFFGRPSATPSFAYNAASSAGSNLSPANPVLLDKVNERIVALKKADPKNSAPVPVELVTSSGSGLDPHITPAAADYQISRVAKARKMSEEHLRLLVRRFTEERPFDVLGEPRVNVLLLNLALDGKIQ